MNPLTFGARGTTLLDQFGRPAVLLALRLFIAWVFIKSGWLKVNDWESTLFLFEYEYQIPLLPVALAAFLATFAELVFPTLLVLGLGTRLAALGLLAVTLVIEFLVYPNTMEHYYWMAILATLLTTGAGAASLDQWLKGRYFSRRF